MRNVHRTWPASIATLAIAACGRAPPVQRPHAPAPEPRPAATASAARAEQPATATPDAGADVTGDDNGAPAADDDTDDANEDVGDDAGVDDEADDEIDDEQAPVPNELECPDSKLSVAAIVRQLGTKRDAQPSCSVRHLHEHGRAAVPLLVRQLLVLHPNTRWDTELHVIWCVRALRSIAGQKFEFPTRNKMVRVYNCSSLATSCPGRWVKNTGEPMPFFEEGMSRPQIYLSPPDVRWRVIQAWRAWVKKAGRTFRVQKYDEGGDWFW